jgi:mannose-P-dolichol utilization defect protein 1
VQNVVILGLIFRLGSVARSTQLLITGVLLAVGAWVFGGGCPPHMLTALQAGSVVLLALGGRLPQILLNLRRGDSGELSLISCGLSLAGNLARMFTTLTLVGDPIILAAATTQVGG